MREPRPERFIPSGHPLPRVAYLTGEYPRATDTFIQREVAGLRALGFDIRTASIRKTAAGHIVGPEQAREQASTFHVLPATLSLKIIPALFHALRRPSRFFAALGLAWRSAPKGLRGRAYNLIYFAESLVLARWIGREGIAHLHNHIAKASCTVAMLAARLAGIPYSFTLHGPDDLAEPAHWQLGLKIRNAAFVACISDYCRAQAMAEVPRAFWDRLHVVHCGVDPALYDRPPRPRRKKLLFVGRLASVKGLPVLFDALARLAPDHSDLRLTLIGDGPERAALGADAQRLGIADRLDFLGYQNQSFVAAALAEHDVLVLPSFAEGIPVVLMEAMAARLPVVASRVAGVPELVTDGETGYLVPAGNVGALADGIAAALVAPAAMGEAARQTVISAFDSRIEATRLASLFAGGGRS